MGWDNVRDSRDARRISVDRKGCRVVQLCYLCSVVGEWKLYGRVGGVVEFDVAVRWRKGKFFFCNRSLAKILFSWFFFGELYMIDFRGFSQIMFGFFYVNFFIIFRLQEVICFEILVSWLFLDFIRVRRYQDLYIRFIGYCQWVGYMVVGYFIIREGV